VIFEARSPLTPLKKGSRGWDMRGGEIALS